jgi:hypothetical protein
VVVSPAVIG